MFFKNRELTFKVNPATNPDATVDAPKRELPSLDQITDAAKKLAIVGALCVYGYVVLDTRRQVKVTKAENPR
jgi:hypothetical protein